MLANIAYAIAPSLKAILVPHSIFDKFTGAYSVLGVSTEASAKQISRRYRALSSKTHPDKTGGDHELHVIISTAHSILKDDDRRFIYDRIGSRILRIGENVDLASWIQSELSAIAVAYATRVACMLPSLVFLKPPIPQWILNLAATVLAGSIEAALLVSQSGSYAGLPVFQWFQIVRVVLATFIVAGRWLLVVPDDPVAVQSAQTAKLASDYDMLLTRALLEASQPFKQDIDYDLKAKELLKAGVLRRLRLSDPQVLNAFSTAYTEHSS